MAPRFCIPLQTQPVLVIEKSALTGPEIIKEAFRRKFDEAAVARIKSKPLCEDRWSISNPVIYVIEPAVVQVSTLAPNPEYWLGRSSNVAVVVHRFIWQGI